MSFVPLFVRAPTPSFPGTVPFLGTDDYPKGPGTVGAAGVVATLVAAANVAEFPGVSVPVVAIAVATSSNPRRVLVAYITNLFVSIKCFIGTAT